MPKTGLPNWLDYRGQGGIPTFWARGKFPVVALAFVFNYKAVGLHLFIDGEHLRVQCQPHRIFTVAEDHVLLCDLRVLFRDEEWERLDARVGHDSDWKRVQVECEAGMILSQWGVYVYKEETNLDDIQFTCPYPEPLGTRSLLMGTNMVMMEEGSSVASSSDEDWDTVIQEGGASWVEQVKAVYFHCCHHIRIILSTFKTLFRFTVYEYCVFEGEPSYQDDDVEEQDDDGEEQYEEHADNGEDHDNDVEEQVPPSFSESLQTVVENIKRVIAPRQEKSWSDKDDGYNLECLAETKILSDEDYEDEEEEGESDTEA